MLFRSSLNFALPKIFFVLGHTNFSLNAEILQVNGRLTLGENIGDSAGLVAAYHAYKNRKARLNEPELRLQGLEEYSDDQIFFMGFAQVSFRNMKISR